MANDPSQPPVPHETLVLIGPILVGALLSFMLFGISIVQLYIYHTSFPRDRKYLRISVYSIFVMDIFQSVLAGNMSWNVLCDGWGRPINLRFPGWAFYPLPLVSGIVAAWVQLFYAWRIYQLGKWRFVPAVIIFFSLAQCGAASAIAISFSLFRDIERLHDPNMFARTIIWLGGGTISDLTIMTSMVYLLYAVKKNMTHFHKSDLLVNRVLRLSVETGSACALTASLELILFLALPDTNFHFIFALILSKVYSNTLMASLNSRARGNTTARKTGTTIGFNNFSTIAPQLGGGLDTHPNLQSLPVTGFSTELGTAASKGESKTWDIELRDSLPGSTSKTSEADDGYTGTTLSV